MASVDHALSYVMYIRRDLNAVESYRNEDDYPMVLLPSSQRSDLLYLLIIAPPPDSQYAHAPFFLKIETPKEYPHIPPKLTYLSVTGHRVHPNFYANGKVCLSILGTWSGPPWNASMGLNTIALSIYSLLNISNPLSCEPRFEGEENYPSQIAIQYNRYIQLVGYKYLLKQYNGSDMAVKNQDVSRIFDVYLKYYLRRHLDDIDYLGEKLLHKYENQSIEEATYGNETVVLKQEDKTRIMAGLLISVSAEYDDETLTVIKHFPQMLEVGGEDQTQTKNKEKVYESESDYDYDYCDDLENDDDDDDDDAHNDCCV